MKTQSKTKNTQIKKASRRSKSSSRAVSTIHAKYFGLRHFRLVDHRHTGKLIHHRHTSHLALFIILIIIGFLLFMSDDVTHAETAVGTVSVGVIVPGPLPKVGAVITSPIDGADIVDQQMINISGKCLKNTFVVIQNNNIPVGSTVCSNSGTFELKIQLQLGANELSAMNYDNLNQPGPTTPTVTVYLTQKSGSTTVISETPVPVLPKNPSIISSVVSDLSDSDCDDYKTGDLPVGGEPHMAIVCVPRLFQPKLQQVLGVLVWGGAPPYAITVDWGNNSESTLVSLPAQGYKKETFSYGVPGTYKISLKLKDSNDKESIVQTAVQVNGEAQTPIASITNDLLNVSWVKTPVPLYILAVAMTLGFWIGDMFSHHFGMTKHHRKSRKAA